MAPLVLTTSALHINLVATQSDQRLRTPWPPGPWSTSRAGAPVPGGAAAGRRQ